MSQSVATYRGGVLALALLGALLAGPSMVWGETNEQEGLRPLGHRIAAFTERARESARPYVAPSSFPGSDAPQLVGEGLPRGMLAPPTHPGVLPARPTPTPGGVAYGPSQPESLWCWHLMPKGLIYPAYLAGAKESRFRSVWHDDAGAGAIWDAGLGGHVGLLRYGSTGDARPEGVQLSVEGAGLVRLETDDDLDVAAVDFRIGVPLTWGTRNYQTKFGYYHLSSHTGDEFLLDNPGFTRLNYVRDALVWGHSLSPHEDLRVYLELAYSFNAEVAKPWQYQFGVEWAPTRGTGLGGAPFAAAGAHVREEVNFGGNFVVQAGWAWRGTPATGMYRVGVEYYNGKNEQYSFFNDSEQKIGVGMWYDY